MRKRILANESERRKNELRKLGRRDEPNSIREKALMAQYEQRDEVKQINQMILYSKVNTIRHAQIEQKKVMNRHQIRNALRAYEYRQIEEAQSAVDKQLDLLMDIERLRELQQEDEREQVRLRVMREEAELIRNQIAQRDNEPLNARQAFEMLQAKRELELAERERERQMLLKQMEKLRLEEDELKTAKDKVKRMLMQEVNNHNANSLKEKEIKLAEKAQEDMKIAQYQREKAQREKELEEKKREAQTTKEKELAALHANHERALDKAAELDAIRARRAMDERENKERLKEEQEKQRLEKINAELAEARHQQHFEKLQTLAQMAVAEREEFNRVARVQRETEAAERKKREEEFLRRSKNAEELQQQIREHQKEKEKRLQEKSEEAIKLKQQQAEDQQQIESIRVKKLKELEKSGVTLTSPLQRKNPSLRKSDLVSTLCVDNICGH